MAVEISKEIKLTGEALQQFTAAKIFRESNEHKQSLCFSADGQRLLVCDHHNLVVYDCTAMTQRCQVLMHQFNPEVVCFTSRTDRLLHSCTKSDLAIRYLDLTTRQHVRHFKGHTDRVHCLSFRPGHDQQFISAGRDHKLLIWDLRTKQYTQRLHHLENPLLAYDPTGLVFATSDKTNRIEIHDVRMLSEKPCHKFNYKLKSTAKWTQMQFAPNGDSILISTDHSWCFSVDAFSGDFNQSYSGYSNEQELPLPACYTSDSQLVLSGADAGRIYAWNANSGKLMAVLMSNSLHPVRCLQFHPNMAMFVSSDVMTVFWLPKANGQYEFVEKSREPTPSTPPTTPQTPPLPAIDLTNDQEQDEEKDVQFVGRRMNYPLSEQLMRRNRLKRRLALGQEADSPEDGEVSDGGTATTVTSEA
ncbi:WD repeat-containing protein 82 [Drosophila albomicans]|uniref:WD repeat-containing protein 82 n=1 Tax=Drosophila albomicans TaxID=7291 RepID=A0A6P8XRX2_DROAB|nr:WD repeat-containing protein 82 [Drosophila albomicans]